MLPSILFLNIARSSFVFPDHVVDLDPGQGDLDGDGLEYRRQLRRTRCRRQGVKNIMFEFESNLSFIKNIVRWNDQDQIVMHLVECDVRIRRRPFSGRGIVGLSGG
jgi:hypothetical protein